MASNDSDPSEQSGVVANPALTSTRPERSYQRAEREDEFLFHLHRGTELLKGERVDDARRELETALRHQPQDVQGQSLLGLVYFRLGLYAKAIPIYEQLEHQCPLEIPPKINLALCYLKTGEVALTKVLLERVVARVPEHKRAWGYLGLALQRLGEFERAADAFERGGQTRLAARAGQQAALSDPRAVPSADPSDVPLSRSSLPMSGEIHDLDLLDEPEVSPETLAVSRSRRPKSSASPQTVTPRPSTSTRPAPGADGWSTSAALSEALRQSDRDSRPVTLADWIDTTRMAPSEARIIHRLSAGTLSFQYSGVLHVKEYLVRGIFPNAAPASGPSEIVRATWTSDPLHRMLGSGNVLLDAAPYRLHVVQMEDPGLFLRSSVLAGYSGQLSIERRALTRSPGDFQVTRILPTQHQAAVLFVSKGEPLTLELTGSAPALIAEEWLLGWSGQLVIERPDSGTAASNLVIHGRGSVMVDPGRTPGGHAG